MNDHRERTRTQLPFTPYSDSQEQKQLDHEMGASTISAASATACLSEPGVSLEPHNVSPYGSMKKR